MRVPLRHLFYSEFEKRNWNYKGRSSFLIDEQLTEVGKRIRYFSSMCSQNKMVSSKAAGADGERSLFILIRGIRDMAALADVGVDIAQDVLLGRSKTVKDLSDLLKERYPNARGFSVRSIECFCVKNGIRKKVFRMKSWMNWKLILIITLILNLSRLKP